MKPISHLRIERAVWIIGLILAALILGGASSTHAQTSQHRIILSDADGNFEQALAQPAEFLKNSGLSLEDILKLSNTRAAIQIRGAGFVRNFGLMGPEDVQNLQAATLRIGLVGAGAIGSIRLASFLQISHSQNSTVAIGIVNAGFVRDIGLVAPLSLVAPTSAPVETATAALTPPSTPPSTPTVEPANTMTPVPVETATGAALLPTSTPIPSAQSEVARLLPAETPTSPALAIQPEVGNEQERSGEMPVEIRAAYIGAVATIIAAVVGLLAVLLTWKK